MWTSLVSITLSLLINTAAAVTPPEVTPSPIGDSRNRYDAAIVIGNENYHRLPQAIYAYNDASSMMEFMQNTRRVSNYRMTYISNAKKTELDKALSKYYRRTSRKGTLWIYFAGHGYTDVNGNRYLLPVDTDPNDFKKNALEINDIFEQTSQKGNRVVLIVDAGFGNVGRDGLPISDFKESMPYAVANNDPDQILWIADTGTEASPAYIQAQHSIFTYLILGGSKGWADGELNGKPDNVVTMGELQHFVHNKIAQLGQPSQSSIFDHAEITDWPVHSAEELESAPSDAKFEDMSISIRMRNFSNQADLIRAQASKVWNDVLYDVQKGGTQGEESLKRFVERFGESSISVKWMVYIPEVLQAQQMLQDYENIGNISTFNPEICEDITTLEEPAMLGELSQEAIACLNAKLRLEQIQSQKSAISLVLINNAMSDKDWDSWEIHVRNHLKNIDRSQPDLSFAFAVYLNSKGEDFYKEALYWTNYTMDTRNQWPEGNIFKEKSNKLLQLRAQLALEIWIAAEKAYTKERTPELEQINDYSRGQAKNLAREWLDYTRQADLPSETAFNLCMSTSPDPEFCKE